MLTDLVSIDPPYHTPKSQNIPTHLGSLDYDTKCFPSTLLAFISPNVLMFVITFMISSSYYK